MVDQKKEDVKKGNQMKADFLLPMNLQHFAVAGKTLDIKVATTDSSGQYNSVEGLNDASMSIEGDNQDITTFSDNWINRLQGLKDVTFDLSGFYESGDTTGQIVIRDALLNDTALFVQFIVDSSPTGFQCECKVASFEISAAVDGVQEVSISLETDGALTTTLTT